MFKKNSINESYLDQERIIKIFYGRNIIEILSSFDFSFSSLFTKFLFYFEKNFKKKKLNFICPNLTLILITYHSFIQCDLFSGENLNDIFRSLFKHQDKLLIFFKKINLSNKLNNFLLQKISIEKKKPDVKIFFYYFRIDFVKKIGFENFFFFSGKIFSCIFLWKKKNFIENKIYKQKKFLECIFNQKKFKKHKLLKMINFVENSFIVFFLKIHPKNFANFSLNLIFFDFFIKNSLKFYLNDLFIRFKKLIKTEKTFHDFRLIKKKLNPYQLLLVFQSVNLLPNNNRFFSLIIFFGKKFFQPLFFYKHLHPLEKIINFNLKSFVF